MQDCWRRIGCAELFIATMNPAPLHLIILLNYYQSSPTVTFIWSCFHLPQKTFVDIILILVCVTTCLSQLGYFSLYNFCFPLLYRSILPDVLFHTQNQLFRKEKKTHLPVFHISRWRNYFKVFSKVQTKAIDLSELYIRLDLIKRA